MNMELMGITTILTGVNIILVIGLLWVYLRNLQKMKSMFTLGLVIFASLFLLQNAVSFYFFITMMPYFVNEVESHVFILTFLQTLAFGVMNWITWR